MKILLLSTFDLEGGAARASYRLHRGLKEAGTDCTMIVQQKSSDDSSVSPPRGWAGKNLAFLRPKADSLPVKLRHKPDKGNLISTAWLPDGLATRVRAVAPDLINLHWINFGFLRIETLAKLRIPLVWTFHDMWAFTGGCQYDNECGRYRSACGACPQLKSERERDLSRSVWERKRKAWEGLNLTLVSPSRWLADCARSSSLFKDTRMEVIPYGLDLQRFRPLDKRAARDILGLPQDKNLILFGALAPDDRRKGFAHLKEALGRLAADGGAGDTELVIFGSGRPERPADLGFPVHYTGRLHDDISLSLLYSAADVFVAPSLQDNLPNTVLEAMACGTPSVAFRIGGMPDMIDHGVNGHLSAPFDTAEMAHGLRDLLGDPRKRSEFGAAARKKAEREYPLARQAEAYRKLYAEIIRGR